jgi:hypothetical protein
MLIIKIKSQKMKNLEKLSILVLLTLISGIGFYSCTKDPEIVVTPKTLSEYISEFGPFVNSELAFTRSIKAVGYNKNEYSVSLNAVPATAFATIKPAYLTALKADSALLVSQTVTIPQIVVANQALGAPGKAFWTGINQCDKRVLNDSIVSTTAYNTKILAGTTAGTVPAAAKTTFTADIKTATTTRDASTTILDRQVKEAIDKLFTARKAFQAAITK